MLESKQHVPFGYVLNFHCFNPLPLLMRKWCRELLYLVMPEDTSNPAGNREKNAARLEASNTRSIIKVVFWVVISITMSIAIGQLR